MLKSHNVYTVLVSISFLSSRLLSINVQMGHFKILNNAISGVILRESHNFVILLFLLYILFEML